MTSSYEPQDEETDEDRARRLVSNTVKDLDEEHERYAVSNCYHARRGADCPGPRSRALTAGRRRFWKDCRQQPLDGRGAG